MAKAKYTSWYKVRSNTSAGTGDWMYVYIDTDNKDVLDELLTKYSDAPTWSEHYRGIDYKKVKTEDVPKEVINRYIENFKLNIKFYTDRKKMFEKMALECKNEFVLKKCDRCKGSGKAVYNNNLKCMICDGTGKCREYILWNI